MDIAANLCPSSVTLRREEHRHVQCDQEDGHPGDHEGEGVIWTDERCWYPDLDHDRPPAATFQEMRRLHGLDDKEAMW